MRRFENGTREKRRKIKQNGVNDRIVFILCQKNNETPLNR